MLFLNNPQGWFWWHIRSNISISVMVDILVFSENGKKYFQQLFLNNQTTYKASFGGKLNQLITISISDMVGGGHLFSGKHKQT